MHFQTRKQARAKALLLEGTPQTGRTFGPNDFSHFGASPVPDHHPRPAPPLPAKRVCPIDAAIAMIGPKWNTALSADDRNKARRTMALLIAGLGKSALNTDHTAGNLAIMGLASIGIVARGGNGAPVVIPASAWTNRNTTR